MSTTTLNRPTLTLVSAAAAAATAGNAPGNAAPSSTAPRSALPPNQTASAPVALRQVMSNAANAPAASPGFFTLSAEALQKILAKLLLLIQRILQYIVGIFRAPPAEKSAGGDVRKAAEAAKNEGQTDANAQRVGQQHLTQEMVAPEAPGSAPVAQATQAARTPEAAQPLEPATAQAVAAVADQVAQEAINDSKFEPQQASMLREAFGELAQDLAQAMGQALSLKRTEGSEDHQAEHLLERALGVLQEKIQGKETAEVDALAQIKQSASEEDRQQLDLIENGEPPAKVTPDVERYLGIHRARQLHLMELDLLQQLPVPGQLLKQAERGHLDGELQSMVEKVAAGEAHRVDETAAQEPLGGVSDPAVSESTQATEVAAASAPTPTVDQSVQKVLAPHESNATPARNVPMYGRLNPASRANIVEERGVDVQRTWVKHGWAPPQKSPQKAPTSPESMTSVPAVMRPLPKTRGPENHLERLKTFYGHDSQGEAAKEPGAHEPTLQDSQVQPAQGAPVRSLRNIFERTDAIQAIAASEAPPKATHVAQEASFEAMPAQDAITAGAEAGAELAEMVEEESPPVDRPRGG
jgi:hypothetical protein